MFNMSEPFKCHSTNSWLSDGTLFVNWASNHGWGQLTFGFDRERNKLICGNEMMGKESIKEILRQMVDDNVVLSDFRIGEHQGEWIKKIRILDEMEAGLVFETIMQKQYGGRSFTKFHRELQLFEDRWENAGKIFCVFSHESQNTTQDEETRWFDIDTFKLGKDQDDRITVITGFTRIEEWSWVAEPINKENE